MKIYLDNAATTELSSKTKERIKSFLDIYFNPSSVYQHGHDMRSVVEASRTIVANFINANPYEIIFTSGGSASNTLAIKGYSELNNGTVIYSSIGHKSMIKCAESCKESRVIMVDNKGFLDRIDLRSYLKKHGRHSLVTIDYANSEIGTIQKVKEIIDMVHFYDGVVYLDCTGSISQIPIDVKDLDADMIGFSGHKLHALKGIGVLYKKPGIILEPLIYGSQEQGLFSGTENVLGIISLAQAISEFDYSSINSENRDYVLSKITEEIGGSYLIGAEKNRLPYNLYMCFKGISGESLMTLLDENGIMVSTGSACNSGSPTASSTLKAIEMDENDIHSCIRLTFSGKETKEELDYVCEKIKQCVSILRKYSS